MAFSTLTNAKTILGLGPDRSILGTIIRPDRVLLERKGGSNGELTFERLLPGAGKAVEPQLRIEHEFLCNWQLDEDEPLPRENNVAVRESGHSSQKRKAFKDKLKGEVKENGEMSKKRHEGSAVKKKRRFRESSDYRDGDDLHGGGGYYGRRSPWSRSC